MINKQTTLVDNSIEDKKVSMDIVFLEGENFYKIANNDAMRPFFMSIVSDSNHW